MKIFEVTFSLCSGGGERMVVDLCNEFVRNGHEVVLVTIRDIDRDANLSFNQKFLDPAIKIFNLKITYLTPMVWFAIGKLLRQERPDVVHMHLNVLPYFLPFILNRKTSIRFFHTIHSIASKACGYRGQRLLNRWLYKRARVIPITISDSCNRSYQEFYHLPPAHCIYNGRTALQATPDVDRVKKEIESLKLHPKDRVFVQIATIGASKNQLMAARVFARLYRDGVQAILLMLGKTGSTEYLSKVQKEIAPNTFMLGEKSNVVDYLTNADAFCLSSHYEGLPISILEAFACGDVPICTAVGGIPDIVTEGKTGYLADEVTEEAFYAAVKRFLNAPEQIAPETLKRYFADNFTMERCAGSYLALFRGKLQKQEGTC